MLGYVDDSDDFGFALTDQVILANAALERAHPGPRRPRGRPPRRRPRPAGVLRADLPLRWFGHAIYGLLVAAREAVRIGDVARRDAGHLVLSSLLAGVVALMTVLHERSPQTAADPRRWWALAVLAASLLVVVMDMTILNVALPEMAAELHLSSVSQLWVVDAYALALAGLLVPITALGDRWGRKRMLHHRLRRCSPSAPSRSCGPTARPRSSRSAPCSASAARW